MGKLFKLFLFILLSFIVIIFASLSYIKNNFTLENILNNDFAKNKIVKILDDKIGENLLDLIPTFLGFDEPKKYLVLFLNDTELRPAGGFIGSYAVLKIDKGKLNILKLEGSEMLDNNSPEDFGQVPPDILKKELGVDRWYFRDANWSPDFSSSAKKILELYKGENGLEADNLDAIFAIDTKFLEELLKITGELNVEGEKFNSENVVEKIEYEVEYDFSKKGLSFEERKNVLKILADEILDNVKIDVFFNFEKYKILLEDMINEKHFLGYFMDSKLEEQMVNFDKYNFYGKVKRPEKGEDYFLWVDANLAALKTDHAIERKLNYKVEKNEYSDYISKTKMTYIHNGVFDWRTTRYRTYVRLYVPQGSELLSVNSDYELENVEQGQDLDKNWFSYFFIIEPGETKSLEFEYKLSDDIIKNIEDNNYTLFVQKQIGTDSHDLTLGLNFGKTILSADPAELEENWYDNKYYIDSDLLTDKEFNLFFE